MKPVEIAIDIPASRDALWDAWTTADGLTAWLCPRANVDPVLGGAYELFFNDDDADPASNSTLGCRVLAIDYPRLLRFSFRGPDEFAHVMNTPRAPVTEVEVRLTPSPDGTRVTLIHDDWDDGPGWEQARDWFERAWTNALGRLREVVG